MGIYSISLIMRCFIGVLCCPLPVYTMLYIATLNCVLDMHVLRGLVHTEGCGQGGSLGYEEPPLQTKKGPPKRQLECTKRSTRMHQRQGLIRGGGGGGGVDWVSSHPPPPLWV